jgi:hypothetical protein
VAEAVRAVVFDIGGVLVAAPIRGISRNTLVT